MSKGTADDLYYFNQITHMQELWRTGRVTNILDVAGTGPMADLVDLPLSNRQDLASDFVSCK